MIARRFAPYALALLSLLATWLVYRPGLAGGFLFDDFANLPSLGATGPIDNAPALMRYLTSGDADPTGRPLAVASFLIDAQDWPASPAPFKLTNILLHLLNGALLFLVLRKVFRGLPARYRVTSLRADFAALLGMSFWLLHPRLVSTTLYIVQREAMLPATFTLLGLLGWIAGRTMINQGRLFRGGLVEVLSLVACTCLAMLSKANGVLVPVLVLALEYTAFAPLSQGTRFHARIRAITCWSVAVVIGAYLLQQAYTHAVHGIAGRPWTIGERLLTEPRIVWQYLSDLWIPRAYSAGLFNDSVRISTSWLAPPTTLPALLGLVGLASLSIAWRRRYPIAAASILFYLAGQLLESTSIPLELYFEHRNYLPAMFLFIPAAAWLAGIRSGSASDMPVLFVNRLPWRLAIAVSAVMILGGMTYANASIWGDTATQAGIWARLSPDSARAQVTAAQDDMAQGRSAEAVKRLEPLLALYPDEVQVSFNLLGARCVATGVTAADIDAAEYSLSHARDPGTLLVSWYQRVTPIVAAGRCPGLDLNGLRNIAMAGLANPQFSSGRRQDLEHILGILNLAANDPQGALEHFNEAFDAYPTEASALAQAAMLGASGHPDLALAHLAHRDAVVSRGELVPPGAGMPRIHAWVLRRQHYWANERTRLEANLRSAMMSTSTAPNE